MINLDAWRTGPGLPLAAPDGDIAEALGVTARQVGLARRRAGIPGWPRGAPTERIGVACCPDHLAEIRARARAAGMGFGPYVLTAALGATERRRVLGRVQDTLQAMEEEGW